MTELWAMSNLVREYQVGVTGRKIAGHPTVYVHPKQFFEFHLQATKVEQRCVWQRIDEQIGSLPSWS